MSSTSTRRWWVETAGRAHACGRCLARRHTRAPWLLLPPPPLRSSRAATPSAAPGTLHAQGRKSLRRMYDFIVAESPLLPAGVRLAQVVERIPAAELEGWFPVPGAPLPGRAAAASRLLQRCGRGGEAAHPSHDCPPSPATPRRAGPALQRRCAGGGHARAARAPALLGRCDGHRPLGPPGRHRGRGPRRRGGGGQGRGRRAPLPEPHPRPARGPPEPGGLAGRWGARQAGELGGCGQRGLQVLRRWLAALARGCGAAASASPGLKAPPTPAPPSPPPAPQLFNYFQATMAAEIRAAKAEGKVGGGGRVQGGGRVGCARQGKGARPAAPAACGAAAHPSLSPTRPCASDACRRIAAVL